MHPSSIYGCRTLKHSKRTHKILQKKFGFLDRKVIRWKQHGNSLKASTGQVFFATLQSYRNVVDTVRKPIAARNVTPQDLWRKRNVGYTNLVQDMQSSLQNALSSKAVDMQDYAARLGKMQASILALKDITQDAANFFLEGDLAPAAITLKNNLAAMQKDIAKNIHEISTKKSVKITDTMAENLAKLENLLLGYTNTASTLFIADRALKDKVLSQETVDAPVAKAFAASFKRSIQSLADEVISGDNDQGFRNVFSKFARDIEQYANTPLNDEQKESIHTKFSGLQSKEDLFFLLSMLAAIRHDDGTLVFDMKALLKGLLRSLERGIVSQKMDTKDANPLQLATSVQNISSRVNHHVDTLIGILNASFDNATCAALFMTGDLSDDPYALLALDHPPLPDVDNMEHPDAIADALQANDDVTTQPLQQDVAVSEHTPHERAPQQTTDSVRSNSNVAHDEAVQRDVGDSMPPIPQDKQPTMPKLPVEERHANTVPPTVQKPGVHSVPNTHRAVEVPRIPVIQTDPQSEPAPDITKYLD